MYSENGVKAVDIEHVDRFILMLRGHKVLLDSDLAEIYGVETKILNKAVKRNIERFPQDFVFQLSQEEFDNLRFQFGTSSLWGGRRFPPYAFTEHGAIMAASMLKSPLAIQMSVYVVRAFVKLRENMSKTEELAGKLTKLEDKLSQHDDEIKTIISTIRSLMTTTEVPPKRQIGFKKEDK